MKLTISFGTDSSVVLSASSNPAVVLHIALCTGGRTKVQLNLFESDPEERLVERVSASVGEIHRFGFSAAQCLLVMRFAQGVAKSTGAKALTELLFVSCNEGRKCLEAAGKRQLTRIGDYQVTREG